MNFDINNFSTQDQADIQSVYWKGSKATGSDQSISRIAKILGSDKTLTVSEPKKVSEGMLEITVSKKVDALKDQILPTGNNGKQQAETKQQAALQPITVQQTEGAPKNVTEVKPVDLYKTPTSLKVKILKEAGKKEEIEATVTLKKHALSIERSDMITAETYLQLLESNPDLAKKPKDEFIRYVIMLDGEEAGYIKIWVDTIRTEGLYDRPKKYVFVEDLETASWARRRHVAQALLQAAISLSFERGYNGHIRLSAEYHSQSSYFLSALSRFAEPYRDNDPSTLVDSVGKKLNSLNQQELEVDNEVIEVKKMLARAEIVENSKNYKELWRVENREVEEYAKTITVEHLKRRWPELLRRRDLYTNLDYDALILDEIAYSKLRLPRLRHSAPEEAWTWDYRGEMSLKPIENMAKWQDMINARHQQVQQRIEAIRKQEGL